MARRSFPVLAAALLLGACSNQVYSTRPLLVEMGTRPSFRPGVWAAPSPGCVFDATKPFAQWPDCAGGSWFEAAGPPVHLALVSHGEILELGEPIIVQSPANQAMADAMFQFSYAAIGLDRRDEAGRITGFTMWPVQCGPPARQAGDPWGLYPTTVTQRPFRGLRVRGENCVARRAEAVRRAAAASRAIESHSAYWVRDADAG